MIVDDMFAFFVVIFVVSRFRGRTARGTLQNYLGVNSTAADGTAERLILTRKLSADVAFKYKVLSVGLIISYGFWSPRRRSKDHVSITIPNDAAYRLRITNHTTA